MRPLFTGLGAIAALSAVALAAAGGIVGWGNLWSTPDQRGRHLMEEGRYAEAAAAFADPMWQGVARFRAGDFKGAAQAFGGLDTAEAAYDQGTALIMLGKYDEAVARFDRALALRPGWADAEANRTLARLRAERVRQAGGDAGDQRLGADQIIFDRDAKRQDGQETRVEGAPMSDKAVRALWLKRVQTRPADFLRARFAYQLEEKTP
ncbi:tetratricopeptide repeat protein [Reyranella sp.]|uniref:tetratricopeptide repeat protein n=1 Tax=Reyranella sp. TaxID=1929291 RepID=UPI003BAAD8CE